MRVRASLVFCFVLCAGLARDDDVVVECECECKCGTVGDTLDVCFSAGWDDVPAVEVFPPEFEPDGWIRGDDGPPVCSSYHSFTSSSCAWLSFDGLCSA